MDHLSQEAFLTLLRRGDCKWSDEDWQLLMEYINRCGGDLPHTDPDQAQDDCDRFDLIELHLTIDAGFDLTQNIDGWNKFCETHPSWMDFHEDHSESCQYRHKDMAEVVRELMPMARAVGLRTLTGIIATDPERGAELAEHYMEYLIDPEDEGE